MRTRLLPRIILAIALCGLCATADAYYYRGHHYPYYYRGHYYRYRHHGMYFRHRYYRYGRLHYY